MTMPPSYEEAAMAFARKEVERVRDLGAFDGSVMRWHLREILKAIIDASERNSTLMMRLALDGNEDAHDALVEAIADRNARGEALGPAVGTYALTLADHGRPSFSRPRGRQDVNFVQNLVIVCLLISLKEAFPGLNMHRMAGSRRTRPPSYCSILSAVLAEPGGPNRGSEESLAKIWQLWGPAAVAAHLNPPKPGVIRFVSNDFR